MKNLEREHLRKILSRRLDGKTAINDLFVEADLSMRQWGCVAWIGEAGR
jgi:hypothetical protein